MKKRRGGGGGGGGGVGSSPGGVGGVSPLSLPLQSSVGPHSLSRTLQAQPNTDASFRPLSRVTLFRRKDNASKFDIGAKWAAEQSTLQQTDTRANRARKSPYLRHLPQRMRDSYLHSIGTLKESEIDDDSSRIENTLRSQLNKIVSPIKAPASNWRGQAPEAHGQGKLKLPKSSRHLQPLAAIHRGGNKLRHGIGGVNGGGGGMMRGDGLLDAAGLFLNDEHFSVSPTSSFSGEDELWSGINHHTSSFPPTNRNVVATPMSDLSDFDRDITPSQFSISDGGNFTASSSSGLYGTLEDEVAILSGDSEYEYVLTE